MFLPVQSTRVTTHHEYKTQKQRQKESIIVIKSLQIYDGAEAQYSEVWGSVSNEFHQSFAAPIRVMMAAARAAELEPSGSASGNADN